MNTAATVKAVASSMKGIDASGVEVDDDQAEPTILVGSFEETAALEAMTALLPEALRSHDKRQRLMCLRARKYDTERAAKLLPTFVALQHDFAFGEFAPAGPSAQLGADIATHKFVETGLKDHKGRAICLVRLRLHRPKESSAEDMVRLVCTNLLNALADPEVQRRGIVLHNDLSELSLKNLDPRLPKFLLTQVFPRMPMRVGRIVAFNPPWAIAKLLLPIFRAAMPKKLSERIFVIEGSDSRTAMNAKLLEHFPAASLAAEYGGTAGDIDVLAAARAAQVRAAIF